MPNVRLLDYRTETSRDGFYATGFAGARFTAPAGAVWTLISDWSGPQRLMPDDILGVSVCGDGTRAGDTRTLEVLPALAPHPVTEVLDFVDEQHRRYAYSIRDFGGMPWARYQGEFEVLANGPDECLVSYVCRFIPLMGDHTEAADAAVGSCRTMFETIVDLLSKGQG